MTKVRYYVDRVQHNKRQWAISQFKAHCLNDLLKYWDDAKEIEVVIYPSDGTYEIEINVFRSVGQNDAFGYYQVEDEAFNEVTRAEDCFWSILI